MKIILIGIMVLIGFVIAVLDEKQKNRFQKTLDEVSQDVKDLRAKGVLPEKDAQRILNRISHTEQVMFKEETIFEKEEGPPVIEEGR